MTRGDRIRRNRILLIGLFAIAIVPLFGAFWLYESARSSSPWATTNHGELLDPIPTVEEFGFTADDGATSMLDSGNWWLVLVTDDGCATQCQAAAHQLRQLHVLLGRDASRVKRAVVRLGHARLDPALSVYPELLPFSSVSNSLRAGVYIVDPLGNVVLRYRFEDAGKPVLEDMKQLLKVSHVG